MRTFRKIERHLYVSDRHLTTLRMAVSAFGESYYFTKNFIDHGVGIFEDAVLQKDYLHERLREYRGQKTVAFLYHGYLQGRSAFLRLERILESPLFGIFAYSGDYQPFCQDLRRSAEYERRMVDKVLAEVDAERVIMVGHSQGGLLIRYMLQNLRDIPKVSKVVTLSTPHQGTWAALGGAVTRSITLPGSLIPFFPRIRGESGFQMLPGSAFLKDLNSLPLPEEIDFTSIFSYIDPLVWPSSFAILPYPEAYNVLMKKIGHFQTIYDVQAYEVLLRALHLPLDAGNVPEEDRLEGALG
ncbi:lipase family alpha/beta hydrolase [Thermodesulfobacteriota bacterium]